MSWLSVKVAALIIVFGSVYAVAQQPEVLGINLQGYAMSAAARQGALMDIRNIGATWFRDVSNSGSDAGIAGFVAEIKQADGQGLHILINVTQLDEDYDTVLPVNSCGWKEKRLSQIDLAKFTARLQHLFMALKHANLPVDAVEFGNEDDNHCYDGDVPESPAASYGQINTWLMGYGKFLQAGIKVLKTYYPQAKVVTFGMAHGSGPFSDPAKLVAQLKNVKGVNYLDGIDGYGTHIYASVSGTGPSAIALLRKDVWALGRDKPFWLTEFGLNNATAFPNKRGKTLVQGMAELLDTLDAFHQRVAMGPAFFYSYGTGLADSLNHPAGMTDSKGNLVPAARIIFQRYKKTIPGK